MLRAFLTVTDQGGERRNVPVGDWLTLGRTDECGLVIDDCAASRRHAEIRLRGDAFYLHDLGSTNGTLVNGVRMIEGQLEPGDHIQIGDAVLVFGTEEGDDDFAISDDTEVSTFTGTILDLSGRATTCPAGGKAEELLQAIYTVTNAIAAHYDPCKLLDRLLETTVRAIRAQRGAVFFAGPDDSLAPCPVCGRIHAISGGLLAAVEPGGLRVSGTIARRVLRDGESVLFQDSGADGEFDEAESIVSLRLRSVICAPLRAKGGVLGILYIDNDQAGGAYTHEDMLLVTAVGKSAGLALENAQMHRQLLDKHLIELDKQRIEQEIAHAWTIQQSFLIQDWPETGARFNVYGDTRPARTVGGDFYDFIEPQPGLAGLLIGDVSGKGVPAALAMAQVLAQFRLHARGGDSPATVLGALNADLVLRSRNGMFCSLCYVTVDLDTGRVLCANAGHQPPLRIGSGGAEFVGHPSGPPAGILAQMEWRNAEFTLAPGDTLLLYTDGITEARRGTDTRRPGVALDAPAQFGDSSLAQTALKCPGLPARDLINAVHDAVAVWCAPGVPHDDCTMMALRYAG